MPKKLYLICIVYLLLTVGCSCTKKDESLTNNNDKVIVNTMEDKIVEDFNFTNTSIVVENGNSRITTTVTNNSNIDKEIESFKIVIKDKEGKTIKETIGYVGGIIKSKGTKVIITNINLELSDSFDIEYSY